MVDASDATSTNAPSTARDLVDRFHALAQLGLSRVLRGLHGQRRGLGAALDRGQVAGEINAGQLRTGAGEHFPVRGVEREPVRGRGVHQRGHGERLRWATVRVRELDLVADAQVEPFGGAGGRRHFPR
ncbi:hypothetical protein [Saccharopolyspora gregorii]|uniref:hypothetical protein n=1 Tax=Saccharopolyspora gregorii TaxID=33914 RepID=UPI003CD0C3A4